MPIWAEEEDDFGADEGAVTRAPLSDEHVVFLVDFREEMGDLLAKVFETLVVFLKTKVLRSSRDRVALVSFGGAPPRQILPLEVPSADAIRTAKALLEANGEPQRRSRDANLFQALNFTLERLRETSGVRPTDQQRIWIFTADDAPETDGNEVRRCLELAKDMAELSVTLELWPLTSALRSAPFDVSKFYGKLLSAEDEDLEVGVEEPEDRVERLLETQRVMASQETASLKALLRETRRRIVRKRRLVTMLFFLGSPSLAAELHRQSEKGVPLGRLRRRLQVPAKDELCITVSLYNVVTVMKKQPTVELDARDNTEVQTSVKFLCKDTGKILEKDEWKTYAEIGGEKVYLTKDDVTKMRLGPHPSVASSSEKGPAAEAEGAEPHLRLLGFMAKQELVLQRPIRSSWWVTPEDSKIHGSSPVFIALHSAMLKAERVAVVAYRRTRTSDVKLALLIPQAEGDTDAGCSATTRGGHQEGSHTIQTAPGFHMTPLPFMDDVRRTPLNNAILFAPEEVGMSAIAQPPSAAGGNVDKLDPLTSAAADFLSATQLRGFSFEDYANPVLQKHYSILQEIALAEDADDEAWKKEDDKCQPQPGVFDRSEVQSSLAQFMQLVRDIGAAEAERVKPEAGGEDGEPDEKSKHSKKKRKASSPSPRSKKSSRRKVKKEED